ncbi:hypothetical protein ACH5RR_008503 [Cinchona calisaya]|uniref:Auxin-responsive protein n=1 Tax=Cinchona calisaya TaxID=153742 RepID=A0ABD3AE19_9GENT
MAKDGHELEITELRLGLPGGGVSPGQEKNGRKRSYSELEGHQNGNDFSDAKSLPRNQVLGWPPECAYRRKKSSNGEELIKMFVKVSMDGAPFLRKIDVSAHKGYYDLVMHLEKLFGCCGIGTYWSFYLDSSTVLVAI